MTFMDDWRKVAAERRGAAVTSPPEMDMAALGIVAAARLSALKDSPRAIKRCASRRARELDVLDVEDDRGAVASRVLLHECMVCGMCAAT